MVIYNIVEDEICPIRDFSFKQKTALSCHMTPKWAIYIQKKE